MDPPFIQEMKMSNPLIKEDDKIEETTKPQNKAKTVIDPEKEALKAELLALKQSNKEFEEETLKKALAKANISLAQFAEGERASAVQEEILEVDIGGQVCHINGIPYTGVVQGPRSMIEMIQSMAGNARNQRLRELVGKQHEIEQLASGGIRTRVIKQFEDIVQP